MATRKPLVKIDGKTRQLPAGDTLPPQAPAAHTHAVGDVSGLGTAATSNIGVSKGQVAVNTANGPASVSFSGTLQSDTGGYNTANGYAALYANTTGNSNTANGYVALYANTTGNSNTAIGYATLYANTTGNSNTAIGYASLNYNTTGNSNTAMGINAIRFTTFSGEATAWNYCVAIGVDSRVAAYNATNEIVIGWQCHGNGSNTATIGNVDTTLFVARGSTLRLTASKTPASASAPGTAGDMCWDSSYFYVCVATNTWKRVALASW